MHLDMFFYIVLAELWTSFRLLLRSQLKGFLATRHVWMYCLRLWWKDIGDQWTRDWLDNRAISYFHSDQTIIIQNAQSWAGWQTMNLRLLAIAVSLFLKSALCTSWSQRTCMCFGVSVVVVGDSSTFLWFCNKEIFLFPVEGWSVH